MLPTSPQLNITQNFTLNNSQILALYSSPFVVVPPETGFFSVFQRAILSFRSGGTAFGSSDNLIAFKTKLADLTEILCSNSLNALNIIGRGQDANGQFLPANPYYVEASLASGSSMILKLEGNNPTGGDSSSTLTISVTYATFII